MSIKTENNIKIFSTNSKSLSTSLDFANQAKISESSSLYDTVSNLHNINSIKSNVNHDIIDEEKSNHAVVNDDTAIPNTINNNWTENNINTLRNWKSSLSKASFIYQTVLENGKKKLNKILLASLIMSTISTIISGISTMALTVNDPKYSLIALIINIIIFVISAIVSLLSGSIKIYKLDESVTAYTGYINKIDQIYSSIASQLVLPDNLREDAVTYIKQYNDLYLNLIRNSPDIESSSYQNANKLYAKFLENDDINFKLSQKYKNEDGVIEVV